MDGEVLERVYKENLEERIIAYLSETKNISLEAAMIFITTARLQIRFSVE